MCLNLGNVIANFYIGNHIDQRRKIFAFTDLVKPAGVPRLKQGKVGDNKRRLDVEDIYGLYVHLDQLKVTLLNYVARDVLRVPNINTSEADVCA